MLEKDVPLSFFCICLVGINFEVCVGVCVDVFV